ncbi:MAG: twin-arginine translocation signal domain-containing protein, partial [Planctomycetaceae bacterium]|nr:twin-arginine translocation signal domain-containing protein [Planctomycetaceae bacterium]
MLAKFQFTKEPIMPLSRRQFLTTAAAGTAAIVAAPAVITASKADKPLIVGEGEHRFEVQHEWPQLPDKYTWQTTHNVAVDKSGNLYVIHEGRADLKDHPSIFVFDSEGKFIRAFGAQFQGGGHGIEIRQEGSDEFLYV